MKVIGIIGLNGSGKDEVVKYLSRKYGVTLFSAGDLVREIAAQRGIEPTRENLDNITREYFQHFGEGYFLRTIAGIIRQKNLETAGISGIRSPQDIAILKQEFSGDFVLIHVSVSDPRMRYERIRKRASKRDEIDYADFLREDQISEELFKINEAINQADFSISNDGSLDELYRQIDQLIEQYRLLSPGGGKDIH